MTIDSQTSPLALFDIWMKEAKAHPHIAEPTAMSLATANKDGEVRVRVVLCKSWSEDGFVFYTNYESRKGRDLLVNPNAALVFYWDALFRQIKISGSVEKTSRAESEAYWRQRARESQLSQHISKQSQTVASRELLDRAWHQAELDFQNREIPCPDQWGGYRLRPKRMEFWIGRPGRFHDRYEFTKSEKNWTLHRLYP